MLGIVLGTMALCRRGRLSIFRGEVGSGHAASGKANRASVSERGGVEKNGVAFAQANASRFFERSRYENLIRLLRDYGAAVAQGTHNPLVVGSNPSGPTIKQRVSDSLFLFVYK